MKKFDILIILIVLLISISFYAVYFSNISDDANIVEIKYKNTPIYNIELDKNIDVIVEISSKNNVLTVKCNGDIREYPINSKVEILNIVSIKSSVITMIDANCDNKYCLEMKLSKGWPSPIVCTNGITVKLISDNNNFEIPV